MYSNLKRSILSSFVVLLLVTAFVPVALAWGPPGSDGWYLGPNGVWYQGMQWGPPEIKYYWPDGSFQSSYPPSCHYEGYYVPAPTWPPVVVQPVPQPPVFVQPAPPCSYPLPEPYTWSGSIPLPSGSCCSSPPIIADRHHIPWGTFGTYDNWAHAFYREHGRCPNEQDVRDFWYSQAYAAAHCGRSPWW